MRQMANNSLLNVLYCLSAERNFRKKIGNLAPEQVNPLLQYSSHSEVRIIHEDTSGCIQLGLAQEGGLSQSVLHASEGRDGFRGPG